MSSTEICEIMRTVILAHYPSARVLAVPVADGGEGSVDAFLTAVGGRKVRLAVKGPFFEEVESFYGLLPDGTAVIEMAAAAGLPLVGDKLQPDKTTTFGAGQLMLHAAKNGAKRIIVGLGGSATNDFGAGAAAALGVRFLDGLGHAFIPVGGTLGRIADIHRDALAPEIAKIPITAMCDIDNPLCGERGAAYVFAPQKGADQAMVAELDAQLQAAAAVVYAKLGRDVAMLPGAGAAGGMGGGMVAFLGARLQMGIETVLDTVGFDDMLNDTDLVFTGEGRLDRQTLGGKVVVGVARRARPRKVPVIAIVGDIGEDIDSIYDEGVSGIFSINRVARDFSEIRQYSSKYLALTMDNLMRTYTMCIQRGVHPEGTNDF